MIFDPDALFELAVERAAKLAIPVPVSRATMRAIVADAKRFAGGRAEDEPAALFYACARHAALFGKIGSTFFDDVADAQADTVGLSLEATELDLILLRGRIAYGAAAWEAVRHDFAGWLRRVGEEPKHTIPKRPR